MQSIARPATMASIRGTNNITTRRQWRVSATSESSSRHQRAAAKYNTGPKSLIYQRPCLANLLELDLSDAVKAHSSRSAQDPQMNAHRLTVQHQNQMEESERVDWNQIL